MSEPRAYRSPDRFLDFLAARRASASLAVELWSRVLERLARETTAEAAIARSSSADLERALAEQLEHAGWLAATIRELDGDARPRTHQTKLALDQTRGIAAVVLSGARPIADVFQALLSAALVDHAGWHLLVQLADEAHDEKLRVELRRRLWQKDDHLDLVRAIVHSHAREAVLGKTLAPRAA